MRTPVEGRFQKVIDETSLVLSVTMTFFRGASLYLCIYNCYRTVRQAIRCKEGVAMPLFSCLTVL